MFEIPKINTIQFVDSQAKLFRNKNYAEGAAPFYAQKVQQGDLFYIIFKHSKNIDFQNRWRLMSGNITIKSLISSFEKDTQQPVSVFTTPSYDYSAIPFSTSDIDEGLYQLRLRFERVVSGDVVEFVNLFSEPIEIKEKQEGLLLQCQETFSASTEKDARGTMFVVNLPYRMRVDGGVYERDKLPFSEDTIYEREPYLPELLYSVPFSLYNYTFGDSLGVPFYVAEKINLYLSCPDFRIDGIEHSKREGSEMERIGEDIMGGYSVELIRKEYFYTDEVDISQAGASYSEDFNNDFET